MKNSYQLFLVFLLSLFSFVLKADEGMWLLHMIEYKYENMHEMGLELPSNELYHAEENSLKDVIVRFGNGCTGSLISPMGLIVTNHHCGYGQIQSHSSVENDYLSTGFWARSYSEELPNEGLTVQFLVRMEDVTEVILGELSPDMNEAKRLMKIEELSRRIENAATTGTHYEARVSSFFEGKEFFLMVYEVYYDIRLVGAPPSYIGDFGSETDNWMWPRHTGDFAFFRVYTGPDGKPATYAEENIPMNTENFLQVSAQGVQKGDFSMIMGYPGRTNRYLTSHGIKQAIEQTNPTIIKIRERKLEIMRNDMEASDEVRIQYASKYAQTSNYWKYFIGQTQGLKQLRVYDRKKAIENELQGWIAQGGDATQKYAHIFADMEAAYDMLNRYNEALWYYIEAVMRGSDLIMFSRRFQTLYNELLVLEHKDSIPQSIARLEAMLDRFYRNFNEETDKKIFAALLEMTYNDMPPDLRPDILNRINRRFRGDFERYADRVYRRTMFTEQKQVENFLSNPSARQLRRDPVFELTQALFDGYFELYRKMQPANELLNQSKRLFIAALREMNPETIYYPDANGTMRLTYGQVLDYSPADAVRYNYITTTDGILQKRIPGDREFDISEKLNELILSREFGSYNNDGVMYVNFVTNNDITGGNSGSPVINGQGHLIGVAFDGNWEAMSGDIFFEPEVQRTIAVDTRYMLFILENYAQAHNIIREMAIIY